MLPGASEFFSRRNLEQVQLKAVKPIYICFEAISQMITRRPKSGTVRALPPA
jgi:hypothetical protein